MGLAEFLALAGQYGLWNAVAAVAALAIVLAFFTWSRTRNQVDRERNQTRNAVDKVDADARHKVDSSQAESFVTLVGALNKLVENNGRRDEQSSAISQQMLLAIKENSGITTGMMAAIVDTTKIATTTAATIERLGSSVGLQLYWLGGHIKHLPDILSNVLQISRIMPALETNIEGIADQLQPVVTALRGIDTQLANIATESQIRDNRTNESLIELISLFQETKTDLMKILEPLVISRLSEFLPTDMPKTPNGNHTLEPKSQEPKTP